MICGRCGRKLKDPESIRIGYGPVCRMEMGLTVNDIGKKYSAKTAKSRRAADPRPSDTIPGQMSILDIPEWLPDDMKKDNGI